MEGFARRDKISFTFRRRKVLSGFPLQGQMIQHSCTVQCSFPKNLLLNMDLA